MCSSVSRLEFECHAQQYRRNASPSPSPNDTRYSTDTLNSTDLDNTLCNTGY